MRTYSFFDAIEECEPTPQTFAWTLDRTVVASMDLERLHEGVLLTIRPHHAVPKRRHYILTRSGLVRLKVPFRSHPRF